jgi:apolipoprotein N-acyltransferase
VAHCGLKGLNVSGNPMKESDGQPISLRATCLWMLLAAGLFQAAYASVHFPAAGFCILGYPLALLQITRQPTIRRAFYFGLATGYGCFAPQLVFFWGIFHAAAIVLWLVLAFWIALFTTILYSAARQWGRSRALWLAPVVWTGLEYTRSELYHLKFSWLNIGYALPPLLNGPGMYAAGFLTVLITAAGLNLYNAAPARRIRPGGILMLAVIAWAGICTWRRAEPRPSADMAPPVRVTGVQLEFPSPGVVPRALGQALARHPDTDLFVLSEYTCDGPVPEAVKDWCRTNHTYLVIGGEEAAPGGNYYNTAFVVGPNGQIVFRQAKSVPIPFFRDGLPAPQQSVWNSPWGRVGLCICYDLSFTRVTDRLVAQGAQLLIVPTMDVMEWGLHQHELHSRVTPVRAAEYGLPIFRLASSGVSQAADGHGNVLAATHIGGMDEVLNARLWLPPQGRLPVDRWLAPFCVSLTGILLMLLLYLRRSVKKELHLP